MDAQAEVKRSIAEFEAARKRPVLIYAANVIRAGIENNAIDYSDGLPFAEMIDSISPGVDAVDVIVVTPGGSAQQVQLFVDQLRARFRDVAFVLPFMCMSAGTIWILSGNEIWMDSRAFLGPIDPQVPGRNGNNWLPAQALLTLLDSIQRDGDEAIKANQTIPWTAVHLLTNLDPKEIGAAMSASQYSIQLAARFLEEHKFRDWQTDGATNAAITPEHRRSRAEAIATQLCMHDRWKDHGHGISREVAWQELRLKIEHVEGNPAMARALRRQWALLTWLFENQKIAKMFCSAGYSLFRMEP